MSLERMRQIVRRGWSVWLACVVGCTPGAKRPDGIRLASLHREGSECLKAAIQYPHNPVVRVEAVEAYQLLGHQDDRPWLRSALLDEHPGVRFAACVAVGLQRDEAARTALGKCLEQKDPGVRVGALFALHAMGDDKRTGELTYYLLKHPDVTARRNAALVLGQFPEPGVVKMLARAMRDPDPGVQLLALEGMARHKNKEAIQQLQLLANSGVGSEEVLAVDALAQAQDAELADFFRYKMRTASHLETQLAAAKGLGLLGINEGLELGLRSLQYTRATSSEANDPPQERLMRVKQLGCAVLEAIGDPSTLDALERTMKQDPDPRVQVAAAKAMLQIIASYRQQTNPLSGRTAGEMPGR